MTVIRSDIDPRSAEFAANSDAMQTVWNVKPDRAPPVRAAE